jgi:hypothetical protein
LKSQVELWRVLANELASRCHTSALRDIKTVAKRVEHEGLSFLTITLPAFAKDFERGLDRGCVTGDDLFQSFRKDSSGLPRFLGGFLHQVFDEHGALQSTDLESIVEAIAAVRQLCYLYAKIELPCSEDRELNAIVDFVSADAETGNWDDEPHDEILQDFSRVSSLLFREVLTKIDDLVSSFDLLPSHGPGATADRLRGNAKYDLAYWPRRLDTVFPYTEFGVPGHGIKYQHRVDRVRFSDLDQEEPSRMVLVPKTMKTPRVIAAEPTALQYMQQAIARPLVRLLEADIHPFAGMIGFTDQTANQDMARIGSKDGSLATLDMKEASDRVSLRQALALAKNFPWFRDALEATRSLATQLPPSKRGTNGRVIPLRKFAAMGSALCFPIEAMCFLTAVFIGIERKLIAEGRRERLTQRTIESFKGSVRVYGDDIIVPVDCVPYVVETFALLGWKVNSHKSFWTGLFRESCGGDFYGGLDVTPVRVRREMPASRKAASEVASAVSTRNQFYMAGLWRTAAWFDQRLVKILPHFPIVEPTSRALGRWSCLPYKTQWADPDLHSPLVRAYVSVPRIPSSVATEDGSLLKCLLSSNEDPWHLEKAGRPSVVDIKLRWVAPY